MTDSSSHSTGSQRWHVHFKDHVDTNAKYLYDVDGKILVDDNNKILNVYRDNLEVALRTGQVRIFRNSTHHNICYRYFVRNNDQLYNFWEERRYGSLDGPNKWFHVYVDEDVDRSTPEYKSMFTTSQEINTFAPQ